MSRPPLPNVVAWLLGRVVPRREAPHVIDDLADDYARQPARGRAAGAWWLARETGSVLGAYLAADLGRLVARRIVLWRDAQHAVRAVRRRPLQSAGVAAMLGSGLAAAAVVVAMSHALLLRPISAERGDALVRLAALDRLGSPAYRFSYAELNAIRPHVETEGTLTAANLQPVVLRVGTGAVQGLGEVVTGGYFQAVTPRMMAGRPLVASDERAGAPPAAVIAETVWRERLGGLPSILGTTLVVNSTTFTIVGVSETRGSMGFAGVAVDVWIPVAHADAMLNPGWRTDPESRWWTPLVLTPAGSSPALDERLRAATTDLVRLVPEPWKERRLVTEPGLVLLGGQRGSAMLILGVLGALAGLMLAVASASAGGLLLAAAAAERQQTAVHLAIGAGQASLVRRRAAEGALVGLAGGAVALGLYAWARVALATIALQPTLVLRVDVPLDAMTAALILGLGAGAGLLLSLGPALWAVRGNLQEVLHHGASRGSVATLPRARRVLVGVQVALSLTLIIGATMFSQSLSRLASLDAGFPRDGLVAMDFDVEPATGGMMDSATMAREALDRVRALPGITGATMANRAPVDPSTPQTGVRQPGDDAPAVSATLGAIADGYFQTVGIPLVSGRDFRLDEVQREDDVAVVNQHLADLLWPNGDALGRALVLDREHRTVRVIGVARDVKYRSLSESGQAHVYIPVRPAFSLALLARTTGDSRLALTALQAELDRVGPGVVGFFPRTMADHLSLELLPSRAGARAASTLGAIALVLSAVGLYGLVAWFVEVRRREIGVRLALGASVSGVRWLVVGQALRSAAPGVVVGMLVAGALAAVAESALVGVGPIDPLAVAAGLASVSALVATASYLPCRRAARVNPADCLRES